MSTTTVTETPTKVATKIEGDYVYFHYDGRFGERRKVLTGEEMKSTFTEIPIIDVGGMFSEKLEDRMKVAKQVAQACEDVGFFYMKNHGVEQKLIDDQWKIMKEYFAMPLEKKMEHYIYKNKDLKGYEPVHGARLDDTKPRGDRKESFLNSYDPEYDPVPPTLSEASKRMMNLNQWPAEWPEFKEQIMAYHSRFITLARQLTRCFALGLGAEETALDKLVDAPNTNQKILHYPPQDPDIKDDTGIGAHTDFTLFTILNQDKVGGLEVLNANAHWVPAAPIEGTFVVNVGDFLMRMANNRFVSTVHRVVNESGKERYSTPFFFSPNLDAVCLPECCSADRPAAYEPLTVGDYYELRHSMQRHRFKTRGIGQ
ncbi:Clavaminate synthase-like protein [Rhizodiscina lignyota]|uniref:Clavaminate synthase-like protein n=1 Tax=Rhizodiscina lignyota TaxID=1504668 RepID=A0A9P4ICH2_9PEZI|nr:Clavaminate synthase-like protein [Rhizodiscina lignyota]